LLLLVVAGDGGNLGFEQTLAAIDHGLCLQQLKREFCAFLRPDTRAILQDYSRMVCLLQTLEATFSIA
jgi:hypothetical protein